MLLLSLTAANQLLLGPHLRAVDLPIGSVLARVGEPIATIYFPECGVVAIEGQIGERARIEVALVGREGLIGWPALLGRIESDHHAVAQVEHGRALAIDAATLVSLCRSHADLWAALLRFVQVVTHQMACAITAHLDSALDQRIARWLLMRHDRASGDMLLARHDEIADALNARRASVTDHLHVLEGEQLIRSRRGRVFVRDRPALAAFAGPAYGAAEAEYRRLIGPFGKA